MSATSRRGSIAMLVVILIVVTVSALLALAGTLAYRSYSERQWAAFKQAQQLGAEQFEIALAPAAWSLDYPQITKLMESRLRDASVFGLVLELDGRQVIMVRNADGSAQSLDRPFATAGLLANEQAIDFSGQKLGMAKIYATPRALEAELLAVRNLFAGFVLLIAVTLSLVLYLLLNRLVVRPLKEVERYAGEVARGEHQSSRLGELRFLGELESFKESIDHMVREVGLRNLEVAGAKERFERVIRYFPTPIALFEFAGEISYLNERFTETFGYTLADIPDIPTWATRAYPDPAYRAEVITRWEQQRAAALAGDKVIPPSIYRMTCKNGTVRVVEFVGIMAPGVNIAILADVTERVRTEQELARHREHLEELVASRTAELEHTYRQLKETQFAMNHAGIAIQWIDATSGRFIYVNNRACELYGYSQKELLNINAGMIVPELDPRQLMALAPQLHDAGRVIESLALTRDGSLVPVESSVYLQVPAAGEAAHYITFTTDITQRKATEQALLDAKVAAEAAARTRSEFLANMSHEIRTPMNAIIGMSQLALHTKLDPKQRNYVEKVHMSAVSLLGILNDILDFSKVEAGRLDVEHVEFLLEPVFAKLSDVISMRAEEKGLELLFDIAPDTPLGLIGDPMRLGQILINLVGNAIKFTERGSVIVSCRPAPSAAPLAEGLILLEFAVRDTGIGMNEAQQSRLFTAFSQADSSISRRFGGSGLGLAICKRLVELMGGQISVSSALGVGSTFRFTACFARTEGKAGLPSLPEDLRGRKVLIVDDSDDAREILGDIIGRLGFFVDSAASAAAALEKLGGNFYDLLVCDWKMPVMDGLQLVRHIQRSSDIQQPAAIIMVSAYGVEELRVAAEDLKLAGILAKPASPSSIYDSIVSAFGHPVLPAAVKPYPEAMCVAALQGVPVLLVEDNPVNQELVCDLLASAGVAVTLANNGREALERLAEQTFACVLMDVQMPVMDGLEATRRIRLDPRLIDLPIIAMTANALPEEKAQTQRAGMNDHITKPIDFKQVLATIGHWAGKSAVTEAAATREKTVSPANAPADPGEPVLDSVFGLQTAADKLSLYRRLLQRYLETVRQDPAALRQALLAGDMETLQRLVHGLKGSSATIGLRRVNRLLVATEAGCRRDAPVDELARLLDELEVEEQQGLAAIDDFLATHPAE